MNEWIRVETAIPPKHKRVLICDEGERAFVAFRRESSQYNEEEYDEHWTVPSPTGELEGSGPVVAWMDLPELPRPCQRLETDA